jgi:hypothetical protein
VAITTTVPGTAIPFTTQGVNNSLSGTWSYNGTTQAITIPMSGTYLIRYNVMVKTTAGANSYRTISSVIYKNGTLVAGTGATTVMNGTTNVVPLSAQCILPLVSNDLLIARVVSNGTSTTITGTTSIFAADNTSTTINIVMIK